MEEGSTLKSRLGGEKASEDSVEHFHALGFSWWKLSWGVEPIGEEIREQVIFFRKKCTVTSQFWE